VRNNERRKRVGEMESEGRKKEKEPRGASLFLI